ncbi:MAG: glycoside hydrolase domain-containing protein, partial [bacterium]
AWAGRDFDAHDWPRRRLPFLVGRPPLGFAKANLGVRACFHRAVFSVNDPAGATGLTLRIVYHGGIRVLINGTEIARGHLPEGEYGPDTTAAPYPRGAYWKKVDELTEKTYERVKRKFLDENRPVEPHYLFCPQLCGSFEDAPKGRGKDDDVRYVRSRSTIAVKRATWERVQTIRERVLGPVRIPPKLLRKGRNVLAVEVRAAPIHPSVVIAGGWTGRANYHWAHALLKHMTLTAGSGAVAPAGRRPDGVQVWVEDIHKRVCSTEFGPPGAKPVVRFVGARNGTCGAQLVVGTAKRLAGLSVKAGSLRSKGGGVLPASALRARMMRPRPLTELSATCGGRSKTVSDPWAGGEWPLRRHGGLDVDRAAREKCVEAMERISFFGQISHQDSADVPPDSCRAVWLSLRVPAGAAPGVYRGAVTVDAEGMEPVEVPVEAEIAGWRLPDPRHSAVLMALEQSPYGVAKHYGVEPWTEEHFALLEASFRQLGRVGNDWLFVPVLNYTEFGNRADSPVRWIRRRDGRLAYDYAHLDRYLALAVKHWGVPRVISFVVMHGNPANPPEVQVLDEATGRRRPMKVGGTGVSRRERHRIWGPFATSLYNHMKELGLEGAMFWGYAWDGEGDSSLKDVLRRYTPNVMWSMGGHDLRNDPDFYTAYSWIYRVYGTVTSVLNHQGWKNPELEFQNPRGGGNVMALKGFHPPFGFRLAVDRALIQAARGLGRIGADYWDFSYYDGTRGREVWLQPGMGTHTVLWPGRAGADSSQRFETLIAGMQESNARVFIERTLERFAAPEISQTLQAANYTRRKVKPPVPLMKLIPDDVARRAARAVFEHNRETLFVPSCAPSRAKLECAAMGWMTRSRRLYRAAAELAEVVQFDVDKTNITRDVPARGTADVPLRLRSWTGTTIPWKAEPGEKWIAAEPAAGSVATLVLEET